MFFSNQKNLSAKKRWKSLLGRLVVHARIHHLSLRDFAPVIAFHRISEIRSGDSLTYDLEDFRRFCTFLSRHFQVMPLTRIVEKLKRGEPFHKEIAITFDDGYRNNYELAAPVLKTLNLPATFFVTTQFMDTDYVPWWDVKLGVRLPWMTWGQVRELHRLGFEIGSHTCTHADLGKTAAAQASDELVNSRKELEDQLSDSVTLFAYPYGGRDNMTQATRELVKVAGYSCCCSCFGGLNARRGNPFDLRRIPISNWYQSPNDFAFQLAMHRV